MRHEDWSICGSMWIRVPAFMCGHEEMAVVSFCPVTSRQYPFFFIFTSECLNYRGSELERDQSGTEDLFILVITEVGREHKHFLLSLFLQVFYLTFWTSGYSSWCVPSFFSLFLLTNVTHLLSEMILLIFGLCFRKYRNACILVTTISCGTALKIRDQRQTFPF